MGKTTLGDVAEAAGVSKGAASHVFNHPERVRQEVRDRVLKTAKELGYQGPNPAARVLRAGQVGSIGVITSNPLSYFFTDPFARVFMQGVSDECDAHGIGLSLISTVEKEQSNWSVTSALVDSFIVLCTEKTTPLRGWLCSVGFALRLWTTL
jgi:DNA-binding LacI/PurR family transcriptional regulator